MYLAGTVAGGTGLFSLKAEEAAGAGKGFFQRYFNRVFYIMPSPWLGAAGVSAGPTATK